jgi:hypothetical protein
MEGMGLQQSRFYIILWPVRMELLLLLPVTLHKKMKEAVGKVVLVVVVMNLSLLPLLHHRHHHHLLVWKDVNHAPIFHLAVHYSYCQAQHVPGFLQKGGVEMMICRAVVILAVEDALVMIMVAVDLLLLLHHQMIPFLLILHHQKSLNLLHLLLLNLLPQKNPNLLHHPPQEMINNNSNSQSQVAV